MKKVLLVLSVFVLMAFGGDYEDARKAEKAGDAKKAVDLYQKAADAGNAQAQWFLAAHYQYGDGIKQNYKKAFEWYKKVADQGYSLGYMGLAKLYKNGLGVEKDAEKVLFYYEKSAGAKIRW